MCLGPGLACCNCEEQEEGGRSKAELAGDRKHALELLPAGCVLEGLSEATVPFALDTGQAGVCCGSPSADPACADCESVPSSRNCSQDVKPGLDNTNV